MRRDTSDAAVFLLWFREARQDSDSSASRSRATADVEELKRRPKLYRHCKAKLIPIRPSSGLATTRLHSLSLGMRATSLRVATTQLSAASITPSFRGVTVTIRSIAS